MSEACLLFRLWEQRLVCIGIQEKSTIPCAKFRKGLWNLLAMCLRVPGVVAEVDWLLVLTLFSAETIQDS